MLLPENQPANFSLLQLALPGKSPQNIGIFLFDTAEGRLYKKLRRDWKSIADPENVEILELLDAGFRDQNRGDGRRGLSCRAWKTRFPTSC